MNSSMNSIMNNSNSSMSSTPDHFLCPLTLEVMEHPVTHKETGNTFEKGAIFEWMFVHQKTTCPLTRQPLRPSDLEDNDVLKYMIDQWKDVEEMEMRLEQIIASSRR
ncbi:Putative E3 ubiquitin-protein ligase LIN [Seminavis robusta]|uniref:E3 ubiquitin-protein ligase LIN n=1 Tax=Seminavis robusta TaxID=568900 RepID=A0A9N8EFE6_9STRA|nr:Putative E3 ubiquitin-protein ligase LIN [Seminavis robusta]|eukprot:Sro920_g220200.1 Putative E3 ubiquitin-protein ligase LIN (107) ;mRNA; f:11928-12248